MHEITAIFCSAEQVRAALGRLRAFGIPAGRIRAPAGHALHVELAGEDPDLIARTLREAGADDVSCHERARDPGWMSHHGERVTGARVQPGEGDSEAGEMTARRT